MQRINTYTPEDGEFLNSRALRSVKDVPHTLIPLMEVFYTLEGEGLYIGTPRVLARVSGCAVMCSWCDTKHTWMAKGTPKHKAELVSLDDFVARCVREAEGRVREISITGGEPMHYPEQLKYIIRQLSDLGYLVSIETSGLIIDPEVFGMAHSVSMDIKTPSSGVRLAKENIARMIEMAYLLDEVQLKAVVWDEKDLEFILDNFKTLLNPISARRVKPLVITPCADNTRRDVPPDEILGLNNLIMEWNKGYNIRVITQAHKLLGMP